MPNNYDPVAGYYDLLCRLVFGRTEIDAQVGMLRFVRPGNKLLIVGGGTGWILEKIAAIFPAGLDITYVECSVRMMRLARRRKWGGNTVKFILLPVEEFLTDERYDCILTGFLFDNFYQDHAERIVRGLDGLLKEGGFWLYADLYYPPRGGRWWHGLLLRSMYWAARWLCRVEANVLPDMAGCFAVMGYKQITSSSYYGGFIQAIVYTKSCPSR